MQLLLYFQIFYPHYCWHIGVISLLDLSDIKLPQQQSSSMEDGMQSNTF